MLAVLAVMGGALVGVPSGSANVAQASSTSIRCREVAATAGMRFRGAYGTAGDGSESAGVMQRNLGNGAAVADYDDDGDLDVLLLGQAGHPNRLFRNEGRDRGRPRFRDVTRAAGLGDIGLSRVAHFADLDADGWLDLVVVNDTVPGSDLGPSRVYRNRGDGTFEDVTAGSGFDPVGAIVGGAALADVDGDGLLDVYLSYWTQDLGRTSASGLRSGKFTGYNRLYRNLGGLHFEDVTDTSGLGRLSVDAFSPVFADFDLDGDQDLYLAVDWGHPDRYYENDGSGRFTDMSDVVGVGHQGNDMGVAVADVDGNGLLDVYVTNITDPAGLLGTQPPGNTMLMAEPGPDGRPRFTDRAQELGITDTAWGWGAAFVDLDLDGVLDLVAGQGMDEVTRGVSPALFDARASVFRGLGDGSFERIIGSGCDPRGDQRAVLAFDMDRDGDQDLLLTQVDRRVLLLENRSRAGRWLTVVPRAPVGRTAIGSIVTVEVAGRTVSQPILAGGSYLSGPPAEATFGLGTARRATRVTVRWPDGSETTISNVRGDRILRVDPGPP
jgi:enediyne biosynthesis protein E4